MTARHVKEGLVEGHGFHQRGEDSRISRNRLE